jgi:hypothetical protein
LGKTNKGFLGILRPDEDSMPCVQREWKLGSIQGVNDEDDIVYLRPCSMRWGSPITA